LVISYLFRRLARRDNKLIAGIIFYLFYLIVSDFSRRLFLGDNKLFSGMCVFIV
jgi:hypothetical protein